MIYELNSCPVCGSQKLNQKSIINVGDDKVIKYLCQSCDSIVSNDSYLVKERETNSATTIYKNALKSVVEITADFSAVSTNGTGILLKDNYVLTNAHILSMDDEIADNIYASFNGDLSDYNMDIISIDNDLDIALLKIENLKYNPISLENVKVQTGEKIYAVGNAIGQGLSIVEGIVSDACREVNGNNYIMHTAPVNHGNSGGPLYNNKGQVIGMIVSSRKDAKSMSYAISNKVILVFLGELINR